MTKGEVIALIKALGGSGGGGGGSLPEVTADDNGDVLTVVSGKWAKAAPSGGGGVLIVNITGGVLDKTWQEIVDAPFAIITEDSGDGTAKLLEAGYDVYQGEYSVYFVSLFANQLTTRIFSAASADAYPRENI